MIGWWIDGVSCWWIGEDKGSWFSEANTPPVYTRTSSRYGIGPRPALSRKSVKRLVGGGWILLVGCAIN